MKKITIKESEEFRVKVITDFNENEFFYDAFVKAKNETECIVKDTIAYHKTKNDTMMDFSNNIIAFSGDRGQGKSSAMLSFSNLLNNSKKSPYKDFLGDILSKNNYIVLDRVDPTKFEDKDNILLIIIGKIFNKFCTLWNNSDKKNMIEYSNLLEQFQLCYDEIMTIKSSEESEHITINPLERLGKIGDSGNLKKDLWKLLELFFDFENRCTNRLFEKDRNYLVIQLDDTDLNTQNAYTIVEDIRKYFMIPNVIVLMAIDISQLAKAIEQYFINKYKVFNEYYDNQHLIEHRKVAVKYIDKLIPGDRKIYLPKLTLITGENAEKVNLEYLDVKQNNILFFKDTKDVIIDDFQELIIRLIYEKTGIVFVKPKTYIHDIIPNTMRELVNFLSILNKMPNVKNSYTDLSDLNIKLENLKSFETYFVEVWIPNYVQFHYYEKVTSFIAASMATKNKQLIKDLKNIIGSTLISTYHHNKTYVNTAEPQVLTKIHRIENLGEYSLADIRTVLNAFEDELPQEDTYKFNFAIETLYTIYINKIICSQLISEETGNSFDVDTLMDFLGGKIFSDDEINNFMRKEKSVINRGAFKIIATDNIGAKQSMEKLIYNDSYLISLFLNFNFRSYQGKIKEYKRPFRLGNGVKSTVFKYEAVSPIMKCLEPETFINRLDIGYESKVVDKQAFDAIRYQCMKIVSNLDLINYISKKLQDYSLMRSSKWTYCEHLINLYERLELCVNDLCYFDLNINFSDLKSEIEMRKSTINKLFSIYKETDAEFDEIMQESMDKLAEYVTKLNLLRTNTTFENIKKKTSNLRRRLVTFNKVLEDDKIASYIECLRVLEKEYSLYHEVLDEEILLGYCDGYNAIVKELKLRFEDYLDE